MGGPHSGAVDHRDTTIDSCDDQRRVLEAEFWPLVLTFAEDDGEVRVMRIDGPRVGHLHCAGIYEKVR